MDIFFNSIPGGFVPSVLPPNGWIAVTTGNIPVTVYVTGVSTTLYLGDVIPVSVVAASGYDVPTDLGALVVEGAANIAVSGFNVPIELGEVTLSLGGAKVLDSGGSIHANPYAIQKRKIIPRKYDVYIDGFEIVTEVGDVEILIVSNPATRRTVVKTLPIKLQRPQIKLITNSIKLAAPLIELSAKPQIKLVRVPTALAKKTIIKKHKPISLIKKQIKVIEANTDQQHTPIKLIKKKIVLATSDEV